MNAQQVAEARSWLQDCDWPDITPAGIRKLSAAQVIAAVARHYDGGVAGFLADSE